MSTTLETHEDFERNCKVYTITVDAYDYTTARLSERLSDLDYALLEDIDKGAPSTTPMADKLLGLEMIVRRIEEAAEFSRVTELQAKDKPKRKLAPDELLGEDK